MSDFCSAIMRRLWVPLSFALLAGASAPVVMAAESNSLGLKGGLFDPPRMAPEFALQGSDGKPLTLNRFRGKLVVLEFVYTSCVDVCPVSLAALTAARVKLGAEAKDVQVIYVTVDPERDTVAHMNKYLAQFDAAFLGATGTAAQMEKVRRDYGISATRKSTGPGKNDYVIGHSSYLYFVDRKGQLRAMLPFGRTPDDIAHDAAILLKN